MGSRNLLTIDAAQQIGRERSKLVSYDNLSVTWLTAAASTSQPLCVFPLFQDSSEENLGEHIVAKLVCKIVGTISFLASSVVLIVGAHVDRYHFLFHVVWGVIAIGFGFLGSRSQVKIFCLVSGVVYLIFSVPGFFLGDPAMNRDWQIGPMHLMFPDDVLHTILGAGLIVVGLVTKASSKK